MKKYLPIVAFAALGGCMMIFAGKSSIGSQVFEKPGSASVLAKTFGSASTSDKPLTVAERTAIVRKHQRSKAETDQAAYIAAFPECRYAHEMHRAVYELIQQDIDSAQNKVEDGLQYGSNTKSLRQKQNKLKGSREDLTDFLQTFVVDKFVPDYLEKCVVGWAKRLRKDLKNYAQDPDNFRGTAMASYDKVLRRMGYGSNIDHQTSQGFW
ncbi:hypothetical protein HOL34_00335 [bacterium]|nr:hypothetical protein [bacterium]MBT3903209.1 hypothetical protein [bacterium]MBT4578154.1 hypothetical protein [bacterium]MBT5345498.1 hypothetical protein [bacterium]MBT6131192.1 hypothetical protein [bacterium]